MLWRKYLFDRCQLPGKLKDSEKGAKLSQISISIPDKALSLLVLQNLSAGSPTSLGEVLERTEHHCLW